MAQNISPDRPQSSNLSKQNDEAVTIKDNHAVSKRLVCTSSIPINKSLHKLLLLQITSSSNVLDNKFLFEHLHLIVIYSIILSIDTARIIFLLWNLFSFSIALYMHNITVWQIWQFDVMYKRARALYFDQNSHISLDNQFLYNCEKRIMFNFLPMNWSTFASQFW